MDLVSVIIPYYKKKKYIKSTIYSVLNQTHQNLEIIIIYDDLNHSDLKIIQKISNLDNRIKIIINKVKLGAGLSRNKGVISSKGNYLAFIDADDIWKKNKIKKQLMFMKKMNYEISHTSYEIIDDKRNIIGFRRARNFTTFKDLLRSCDIGLSTVIMKRQIFIKKCVFVKLKTKEDFVLWLNILKKNITIGSIDVNLTQWRKLENSLSSPVIRKLIDGYLVYSKYMKFNYLQSIYYLFCLCINFLKK
tara:strand:+ start:1341 stop:2081 length:741 start_codon:yes stop_codon:yes gene_type:complete